MVQSKVRYNLWTEPIVQFWVLQNPLKNRTELNLTIPTNTTTFGIFNSNLCEEGQGKGFSSEYIHSIYMVTSCVWSHVDHMIWPNVSLSNFENCQNIAKKGVGSI